MDPARPGLSGREGGLTLVECLVGLTVFAAGVLPLLLVQGRLSGASLAQDLCAAHTLLRGEVEVLYCTGKLPHPARSVVVGGRRYELVCGSTPDSAAVLWRMTVSREGRRVAGLEGLLASEQRPGSGTR